MGRPIKFGEIPGIEEGTWFAGRREMMPTSFHRNWGAGIDGNGQEGTAAIVLSGGYEDDEDLGDVIIYTGAGGNDPNTGRQIEDQTWNNRGNAGLLVSMDQGLPVRVIRGHTHKSDFSPKTGYTYGGLYSVVDAWLEKGKSGHQVCRFKLKYIGSNTSLVSEPSHKLKYSNKETERAEGTILRIIRDTEIANSIKKMYSYECQICRTAIKTLSGFYAEGAHIKPLGRPHNGEDSSDNLLCLCPNHHVMFDKGTFSIQDDFTLLGNISGKLYVHPEHKLKLSNLSYHRMTHGYH